MPTTFVLSPSEVERAVAEVRRICDGLRPAALNELGLTDALAAAVHPLQRFGPDIAIVVDELPPLSPAVEVATYRIAMEATTNAVRHAGAATGPRRYRVQERRRRHVADDGMAWPSTCFPELAFAACPTVPKSWGAGSPWEPTNLVARRPRLDAGDSS